MPDHCGSWPSLKTFYGMAFLAVLEKIAKWLSKWFIFKAFQGLWQNLSTFRALKK